MLRTARLSCGLAATALALHSHAATSAQSPAAASSSSSAGPAAVPAVASGAALGTVAANPAIPATPASAASGVVPPVRVRRSRPRAVVSAPADEDVVVDTNVDTGPATTYMFKGEVKVIPIAGKVKRVAVGNGDLVNASVVDHQLLLLAQAPGETSLVVWNDSGIVLRTKLTVSANDRVTTLARLQRSLGFVQDLTIDASGGRFVVRGKVHPEQHDLIQNALDGMTDVVNLIETDDGSSLKKTVHFKLEIVEISKTAERNLGIAWDQQINGPQGSLAGNAVRTGRYRPFPDTGTASFDNAPSQAGGSLSGAFLGLATTITSKINILANDGDAYILAEPELNSRSGGKATFLSGGEVPIPVSAGFGAQDVIYKEYGIRLEVAPSVDASNVISTDFFTEISQIDPQLQVQGYPAFLTRRTTSQLSLRPGETLAIAGLVNADASNAIDKVPGLGDIPILGHLFKSTDFRNNKSDLVVFVTPYIMDTSTAQNADLLNRASDINADYTQEFGNPSPLPEANERRSDALKREEEDAQPRDTRSANPFPGSGH